MTHSLLCKCEDGISLVLGILWPALVLRWPATRILRLFEPAHAHIQLTLARQYFSEMVGRGGCGREGCHGCDQWAGASRPGSGHVGRERRGERRTTSRSVLNVDTHVVLAHLLLPSDHHLLSPAHLSVVRDGRPALSSSPQSHQPPPRPQSRDQGPPPAPRPSRVQLILIRVFAGRGLLLRRMRQLEQQQRHVENIQQRSQVVVVRHRREAQGLKPSGEPYLLFTPPGPNCAQRTTARLSRTSWRIVRTFPERRHAVDTRGESLPVDAPPLRAPSRPNPAAVPLQQWLRLWRAFRAQSEYTDHRADRYGPARIAHTASGARHPRPQPLPRPLAAERHP